MWDSLSVALGKHQNVISKESLEEIQYQENGTAQGYNRKPSRSRRGSSEDDNNTFKMHIRRTSNHSTSLKAPINWVWKLQKELLASEE